MRQFDVFANPSLRSRGSTPYVVVLQSHLLAGMPTVVVAPVRPREPEPPYHEVSALVIFDGEPFAVSVGEMVAIEPRALRSAIGSLIDFEDDIRRALDRLFTGF